VFRSSLFALLIASVLSLWLLVRPPDLPGEGSAVRPQPTALDATNGATKGPDFPTPTAAAGPSATPTPAPATPAPNQYTVVEGDTWFGIAGVLGVDAEALAAANGRTLDDFIQPGEVLVVP
jgi:LysM repeat protein